MILLSFAQISDNTSSHNLHLATFAFVLNLAPFRILPVDCFYLFALKVCL